MKSLISSIAILGLVGMLVAVAAQGADTAGVTATVTVQNISVSVSDGAIAYGTLAASTSEDTTSSGLNDSQTVTNEGNVTETFNIKGSNSTNWTLAATTGVTDEYVHKFCTAGDGTGVPDPCDSGPVYTALTTTYQTLATSVAAAGTQLLDLQITTPSVSTNFDQQSVNVTVQATL